MPYDLPRTFSSSGWTPTLLLYLCRRDAPALRPLLQPFSGLPLWGPCPWAEGPRDGQGTPGEISPQLRRTEESPHSTCWPCFLRCSPGCDWPSELQAHIVGSPLALHPTSLHILLLLTSLLILCIDSPTTMQCLYAKLGLILLSLNPMANDSRSSQVAGFYSEFPRNTF